MKKYCYDLDGFFSHEHVCQPDPMNSGEFLSPPRCVEEAPCEVSKWEEAQFVGGMWVAVPSREIKRFIVGGKVILSVEVLDGAKGLVDGLEDDITVLELTGAKALGLPVVTVSEVKVAARAVDLSRKEKLALLRAARNERLVAEVDIWVREITLDVCQYSKAQVAAYRQLLKDITEPYKADMSLLDSLDMSTVWPSIE